MHRRTFLQGLAAGLGEQHGPLLRLAGPDPVGCAVLQGADLDDSVPVNLF